MEASFQPNFCSKCGFCLKARGIPAAREAAASEDEVDDSGPLNIDADVIRKSIKISVPRSGGVTLGQAMGSGGETSLPPRSPDRSLPDPKSKDFIQVLLKESASSKGRSSDIEEGGE